MLYVFLRDEALQLERIKLRVAEGGHDVPTNKVIARRKRSFEQLAWFYRQVDQCYIFDNSTGEPQLAAEKMGPAIWRSIRLPKDMEAVLEDNGAFLSGFPKLLDN